jgi:predicted cupin superfamily sugar epimerase
LLTLERLIEFLGLAPLPDEGGLFRQTYLADERIAPEALPARYRSAKAYGSAIYNLLTDAADSFSALHRLPTDEVYHFYLGDPVRMLLLHPDGASGQVVLGPRILEGQHVQFVVPRGVWQGSRLAPGGRWALLGTTMAPAFGPEDYEGAQRAPLQAAYPDRAALIQELTR